MKSEEPAFLDLNRSSFFHRLRVLEVPFAKPGATRQQSATWAENWLCNGRPKARSRWSRRCCWGKRSSWPRPTSSSRSSEPATSIAGAAALVRDACQCGLMKSMELARRRLQELAATSSEFAAIAAAAWQLSLVVRYRRRPPLRSRAAVAACGGTVRAGLAGPVCRRQLRQRAPSSR